MKKMVFVGAAVLASSALAQVAPFDSERLQLDPGAGTSLVVSGGRLMQQGEVRLSLNTDLEWAPLGRKLDNALDFKGSASLTAAWAPLAWLQVGAELPVVYTQIGNQTEGNGGAIKTQGLGTPWVKAQVALLRESPHRIEGMSLSVGLAAGLPAGSKDAIAGDGKVELAPQLSLGKAFRGVRVGADVGALIRSEAEVAPGQKVGNQITAAVGVTSLNDGPRGEVSARFAYDLSNTTPTAELLVGARMPFSDKVEGYVLVGPGLGDTPGEAVGRLLLGIAYGGREEQKLCVEGEPHETADCPDLDDDHDGVKNALDKCPTVAGDEAHQGCPANDQDHDGIADEQDKCPTEPGDAAHQGCPNHDQDNDGIADDQDKCPTEAGDAAHQGCPNHDQDDDGIPDDQDKCPKEAGIAALHGCPAVDTDKDGVPDYEDNCPTEAGEKDNAGCPAKKKQLVQITDNKIEIKQTVYFATGKAAILSKSFNLLNQVAEVLKAQPRIQKVEVQGYTDNTGNADKNKVLSQRRAESVVAYLVKKGVAADRLEAKGFGQENPVADNNTADGRAQNRRVEFVVTRQ